MMGKGSPKLALVPLDARPCTLAFPRAIGQVAGWIVETPPSGMLGDLDRPAECEEIAAWLKGMALKVDAAVVALDTLVYGGLIPARRSPDPLEVLERRLAALEGLGVPLYGFAVTLRVSNSSAAEEEKWYWADHGPAFYQWSCNADLFDQTGDTEALDLARAARATIPDSLAEDWVATRKRNLAIHHRELDLVARGLFRTFSLVQDDCSLYGFNQAEKRQLLARAVPGVLVYPGADEVASALVGRAINDHAGRAPAFRLLVYPPGGADLVAMYEDRPLHQTVACQIAAVGGRLALPEEGGDLDLLLNCPSSGQGDLALRTRMDLVDDPPRRLEPVRDRLLTGAPVAFADVAYANGADPRLWDLLVGGPEGRGLTAPGINPSHFAAFAAWNTAGNTLGTVAALASAWLTGPADPAAHRAFVLNRLADDYLYQSVLRPILQQECKAIPEVETDLGDRLHALWRERFPHLPIRGIAAGLPWKRLFEADICVIE